MHVLFTSTHFPKSLSTKTSVNTTIGNVAHPLDDERICICNFSSHLPTNFGIGHLQRLVSRIEIWLISWSVGSHHGCRTNQIPDGIESLLSTVFRPHPHQQSAPLDFWPIGWYFMCKPLNLNELYQQRRLGLILTPYFTCQLVPNIFL